MMSNNKRYIFLLLLFFYINIYSINGLQVEIIKVIQKTDNSYINNGQGFCTFDVTVIVQSDLILQNAQVPTPTDPNGDAIGIPISQPLSSNQSAWYFTINAPEGRSKYNVSFTDGSTEPQTVTDRAFDFYCLSYGTTNYTIKVPPFVDQYSNIIAVIEAEDPFLEFGCNFKDSLQSVPVRLCKVDVMHSNNQIPPFRVFQLLKVTVVLEPASASSLQFNSCQLSLTGRNLTTFTFSLPVSTNLTCVYRQVDYYRPDINMIFSTTTSYYAMVSVNRISCSDPENLYLVGTNFGQIVQVSSNSTKNQYLLFDSVTGAKNYTILFTEGMSIVQRFTPNVTSYAVLTIGTIKNTTYPYSSMGSTPLDYEMNVFKSFTPYQYTRSYIKAQAYLTPEIHHHFPFSFGPGVMSGYNSTIGFLTPRYVYTDIQLSYIVTPSLQVSLAKNNDFNQYRDVIEPELIQFNFTSVSLNRVNVFIKVSDNLSGIKMVSIANYNLTTMNMTKYIANLTLVEFNVQLELDLFNPNYLIKIYDWAGNVNNLKMGYSIIYSSLSLLPNIYSTFSIDMISAIKFLPNEIDITSQSQDVSIYFTINQTLLSLPVEPKFILYSPISDIPPVDGVLESGSEYRIPITIKKGWKTGILQFNLINKDIDHLAILAKFGQSLNVKSSGNTFDILPPRVNIVATQTYVESGGNPATLEWTISKEDSSKTFDTIYIEISSSYDPSKRTYSFVDQTPISMTYILNTNCMSQTYFINKVIITDIYGQNATYDKYGTCLPYIPVIRMDEIVVNCTTNIIDIEPPQLSTFSLTTLIPNHKYLFNYTVTENKAGISYFNVPVIYLTSLYGNHLTVQSDRADTNTGLSSYSAIVDIPFGFGPGDLLISIYGLKDNNKNFNGYSHGDLARKGYTSRISMNFPDIPVLYSASEISATGGVLTVYGDLFTKDLIGILDCGSNQVIALKSLISSYQALLELKEFKVASCKLSIKIGNQVTNSIVITPTSFVPPPPPCPNDGKCSSNGDCTQFGCSCKTGWTGSDCSYKPPAIPPPVANQTAPTTVINATGTNGGNSGANTGNEAINTIDIVSVDEIDEVGEVFLSYELKDWSFKNVSTDNLTRSQYTTTLGSTNTTIVVTIDWYEKQQTNEFANQTFTLPPSTLKYTVNISSYPFNSQLHSLRIVFSNAIIQKQDCIWGKTDDYGFLNSDTNEISWIQLKINNNILYGRFLKNGMVDGRVVVLSNVLINSNQTSTSTTTTDNTINKRVATLIPYYTNNALIDPDFQVLLDTEEDKTDQCGKKSDDKKISTGVLIGVVIGSVCAAILVTVALVYFIKYKWLIKHHLSKSSIKLSKRKD